MLNCNARTWLSCSAMRLEQDAICCTQLTVGLLLLNSATHFSLRGPQTCSIMSQRMTSPASSRSELVIVAFRLATNTTLAVISGGHWMRNTVGRHSESSPNIMSPTPWLDASTTPTKSGHPATNSRCRVGRVMDSCRIVRQFVMSNSSGAFRWK
jgi:hypothetical protein